MLRIIGRLNSPENSWVIIGEISVRLGERSREMIPETRRRILEGTMLFVVKSCIVYF